MNHLIECRRFTHGGNVKVFRRLGDNLPTWILCAGARQCFEQITRSAVHAVTYYVDRVIPCRSIRRMQVMSRQYCVLQTVAKPSFVGSNVVK